VRYGRPLRTISEKGGSFGPSNASTMPCSAGRSASRPGHSTGSVSRGTRFSLVARGADTRLNEMSGGHDRLLTALKALPAKPADSATRQEKKRYSEQLSAAVALALATELRRRGLEGVRPSASDDGRSTGAERRIAGGIGAKKVDVTWATEEEGLLLGVSIKSINFADRKSGNFQKNLTNRRGDMLFEAVTLHRRFPYAVLIGFFLFDDGAENDGTDRRKSTFENAHQHFKLFTERSDPHGREEQYERMYLCLHRGDPKRPRVRIYGVGSDKEVTLDAIVDRVLEMLAERNPDSYMLVDDKLRTSPSR